MSKPYRLVVFDWEGTLNDTLGQVFNLIALEAKQLHFGEFDRDMAFRSSDLGLVKLLRKLFPKLNEKQHQQLLSSVNQALQTPVHEICLIPGAKEFVQKLYDLEYDLALATNKSHNALTRALQLSGFTSFFKVTRSAGQTSPKPCPQMLEEILEEFKVTPQDALMIGDSVTDIEMAKYLEVDAIGIDFYHQNNLALLKAGALAVFDNYSALATFLNLPNSNAT